MTEEDKISILETSSEDAAQDICSFVEDELIKRPLTEIEKQILTMKAKYWCALSEQRQNLIIQDRFKEMVHTELPRLADIRS